MKGENVLTEVSIGRNIIKISWDENKIEEIESAKKKFKEYTRQGWFAHIEMPDGTKRIIYDFHPSHKKIFLVHPATGG